MVDFFEKVVIPLQQDLLNIVNNRCHDLGINGLLSTMKLLKEYEVDFLVDGLNSKKNVVLVRKGVKIAVTRFTYFTKNQFIIAHELVDPGVNMIIGHLHHLFQDYEYYVGKTDIRG